jgi:hypothetical protein
VPRAGLERTIPLAVTLVMQRPRAYREEFRGVRSVAAVTNKGLDTLISRAVCVSVRMNLCARDCSCVSCDLPLSL